MRDLEKLKALQQGSQSIHVTSNASYPTAKDIPLPTNVEDINAIETGRFSPQRSRDITGDVILTQNSSSKLASKQDLAAESFLQSYDCTGTVSLNSAMQTNVPDPYVANGEPSHLNMPGGEWGRSEKYVAQDLQNSHYTNVKENDVGRRATTTRSGNEGTYSYLQSLRLQFQIRKFSSSVETPQNIKGESKKEDKISELKKAVKDYGATVIVFHVGISLISLGGFYLAVTRFVCSKVKFFVVQIHENR